MDRTKTIINYLDKCIDQCNVKISKFVVKSQDSKSSTFGRITAQKLLMKQGNKKVTLLQLKNKFVEGTKS